MTLSVARCVNLTQKNFAAPIGLIDNSSTDAFAPSHGAKFVPQLAFEYALICAQFVRDALGPRAPLVTSVPVRPKFVANTVFGATCTVTSTNDLRELPSGWVEDTYLQAIKDARHTRKKPPGSLGAGFAVCACYQALRRIPKAAAAASSRPSSIKPSVFIVGITVGVS